VVTKGMSAEAALQEWYEFRDQNDWDNTKAKLMGGKLVEWCEKNNILLLSALTTDKVIKWRLTLPFRSGDSSKRLDEILHRLLFGGPCFSES
jgi:hypothetical protein